MLPIVSVRQDKGTRWFAEHDSSSPALSLVLVSYGSCVYWIEGQKVVLDKNDMLLISDRASFYGKSIPTLAHEKYVIAFRLSEAAAGSTASQLPILNSYPYVKWKTGLYDLMIDRFKAVFEQTAESLPYGNLMGQALLLEALVHANRELDRHRLPDDKQRLAETMRSYIQLHHRRQVTKEHLGQAIGKSPNYAATLYKTVTGQTIGESVHAARIKTAQYMLRHSLLTAGEIAAYVGYSDASYFYRVFKRQTGRTPAELMAERDGSAF